MKEIPKPTKAEQLKARNWLINQAKLLQQEKDAGLPMTERQERVLAKWGPKRDRQQK